MYDTMLFTQNVSIDAKSRLFLPAKNTGVEPGEKLYLFYTEDRLGVIIRSEKSIQELGKKYIEADPKEREQKLEELGDFLLSSVGMVTVDGQGRVGLGVDLCSELNLFGSSFFVGCFDEIRVYPDKELCVQCMQNKKHEKTKILINK